MNGWLYLTIGGAVASCVGTIGSKVSTQKQQEQQWNDFMSEKQSQWDEFTTFGNDQEDKDDTL